MRYELEPHKVIGSLVIHQQVEMELKCKNIFVMQFKSIHKGKHLSYRYQFYYHYQSCYMLKPEKPFAQMFKFPNFVLKSTK